MGMLLPDRAQRKGPGYPIRLVSSDTFAEEKLRTMRAYRALIEEVPSDHGQINHDATPGAAVAQPRGSPNGRRAGRVCRAVRRSHRLAKDERLFAGTSSGGNVVAIPCHSGLRYLSTELYAY